MRKAFQQLSAILFVLFSPIDTFCKNSASIDTLEIKDFSRIVYDGSFLKKSECSNPYTKGRNGKNLIRIYRTIKIKL